MTPVAALRLQIENALAPRIPSALTPAPRILRPVAPTGVPGVDALLDGGLPLGAMTELVGPESSGRTSLALSFLARMTCTGNVCAWVDVTDALDPESAAAAGVDLARLLWVRCGVQRNHLPDKRSRPWTRMEQALRATDLLLQTGGFRAVVLDMGGIAPEHALRVPLATWFRYRTAAERTQAGVLLLTQHACAKSASELLLRFHAGQARADEATVFTGIDHAVEVERRRFVTATENVVALRKPPQRHTGAQWQSRSTWAGAR